MPPKMPEPSCTPIARVAAAVDASDHASQERVFHFDTALLVGRLSDDMLAELT